MKKYSSLVSRVLIIFTYYFETLPFFFVLDFYSEETVNNQGLECLRFLNEVISDFDAVNIH